MEIEAAIEFAVRLGADYADIRWEQTQSETLLVKNGKVESAIYEEHGGAGIRVLLNTWGFASISSFERQKVEDAIRRAIAMAKASKRSTKPRLAQSGVAEGKVKLTPEIEYESEEAKDLSIPEVPLPKKKESTITSNQIINNELLNIESETIDKKIILAYCDICKKTLQIKLNKNIILQSDLPLIEISYIHGDPIHALNFQVDKAFSVRRTRVCSALFENE